MTTVLAWLAVACGALAGVVVAMTLVGACLPRQHTAVRTVTVGVDPATVWGALVDYPGQLNWRHDLSAVDRLPDAGGGEVWRESYGRNAVDLRTIEAIPPARLVRQVADESGPFRGRWEFAVEPGPTAGHSRLTLTEHGEVANPFFRFVTRFVIGQATTVEGYLKDLTAKFGAA